MIDFNFEFRRYPFEWKTPQGYFIAFSLQYSLVLCTAHIGICNTGFITGSCWMLISLAKDIKEDIHMINEKAQINTNRLELMGEFSQLLSYHSNVRQLSFHILNWKHNFYNSN